MVQKYDFVITSGGIGPTHDGTQTEMTVGEVCPNTFSLTRATLCVVILRHHLCVPGKGLQPAPCASCGDAPTHVRIDQTPVVATHAE